MILVSLYQSDTLCTILVSCGDRSVKGIVTCYPPYEDKPALFKACIASHHHLVPDFEPYALKRETTNEITGEDREALVEWLVRKMTAEIRAVRIHDHLRSNAKESNHAPAV